MHDEWSRERKTGHQATRGPVAVEPASHPGKRTLTETLAPASAHPIQRSINGPRESLPAGVSDSMRPTLQSLFGGPGACAAVQQGAGTRAADGRGPHEASAVQAAAERGIATPGGALPYAAEIQRSFGRHDVSSIQAHMGDAAGASARAMGAAGYASSHHVVFDGAPDLHTAAHEAAHVVQQQAGVQLAGGVGEAGDRYERHADAVADLVVRGQSAEALLDTMAPPRGGSPAASSGAVQRAQIYEPDLGFRDVPKLSDADMENNDAFVELMPGRPRLWADVAFKSDETAIQAARTIRGLPTALVGDEVAPLLNGSPLILTYVGQIAKGRFSDDNVKVAPSEELFESFYVKHLASKSTSKEVALAEAKRAAGCCVRGCMILLRPSARLTVTIHEALHELTNPAFLGRLGFSVNEGTTEYFTQKVVAQLQLPHGNTYHAEVNFVKALITLVGEDTLAHAYFHGDYATLKDKVNQVAAAAHPHSPYADINTYELWRTDFLLNRNLVLPNSQTIEDRKMLLRSGGAPTKPIPKLDNNSIW